MIINYWLAGQPKSIERLNLLSSILDVDLELFRAVNAKVTSPFWDPFMVTLSAAWFWWSVTALVLIWALVNKRKTVTRALLLIAVAMGISDLVAFEILKPTFKRERPCRDLTDVRLVDNRCGGDFGFPSNHAANGFAAVTVAWLVAQRYRQKTSKLFPCSLISSAALVAFSRVYLGVHYPLDVVVGALFGSMVGALCYLWVTRTRLTTWFFPSAPQET